MCENIKYRHNIININSINAFVNIHGGVGKNCRDVYFIRTLGIDENFILDLEKAEKTLYNNMSKNILVYKRIEALPNNIQEIDYYELCYQRFLKGENISTKVSGINTTLDKTFSNACKEVLKLYKLSNKNISLSMEKNYCIKLFYRFDTIFSDCLKTWSEKINIKVITDNIVKLQDYLFFYMLTLIGADVLMLQSKNDIEIEECFLNLSKKLYIGSYSDISLPIYKQKADFIQNNANIKIDNTGSHREKTVSVKPQNISLKNDYKKQEKTFEQLADMASSIVMITIKNDYNEIIATGSGIMIGQDGYILTNNHVTGGGREFIIRIENDETLYSTTQIIKYNQLLDLAIIRIEKKLHPLKIYDGKDDLVRGQKVVAIGSPYGFFNSVSDGIISGFRIIDDVDMIQFTAPISAGSSGGAVLNMYGEVIGISTAGIRNAQNINLAVSYESIKTFVKGFI